jgi:hypothetical protein
VSEAPKKRFLVVHDYGMGGLWWWINARSAREIVETFAETEVVENPEDVARCARYADIEVDVDAETMPPGLDELRQQRDAQRGRPGFGALAGRDVVYLRRPWDAADDPEPGVYVEEIGADGRRRRLVELYDNGTALRSGPDDWLAVARIDLHDPDLVPCEIEPDEFERIWRQATYEEG